MALSAAELLKEYPIPVYRFSVDFGGESVAFSEVSGLDIENEVITYKDCQGVKTMPGMSKSPINLTLKKGVLRGDSSFYDWITSTQMNSINKKDISVTLMDEKGETPLVTWKVFNSFPTKLTAPTFDASTNDVAIDTLELVADHLKIEYA